MSASSQLCHKMNAFNKTPEIQRASGGEMIRLNNKLQTATEVMITATTSHSFPNCLS